MEFLGFPPLPLLMCTLDMVGSVWRSITNIISERLLESVSRLLGYVEGKIIISADHGEFLGLEFEDFLEEQKEQFNRNVESKGRKKGPTFTTEDGRRIVHGHIQGVDSPVLKEVPWKLKSEINLRRV